MIDGYVGKLLFVDLSSGEVKEEDLAEELCDKYIGGYGIGAKIIYDRQKGGVDALGPDNIFGVMTSPLTGTPVPATSRFTIMAKSPLTGGWGDANSGGYFGPFLKFAGYDGVFIKGASDKPVSVVIQDGKTEIVDASELWGKDTVATDDILREKYGKNSESIAIGPGGERLSLISGIMTKKGSAAARSGLGAVMGAKKLKSVTVIKGDHKTPIADEAAMKKLRKEFVAELKQVKLVGLDYFELFHKYGTSGAISMLIKRGSTPVKNWGGVAAVDFPAADGITPETSIANQEKNEGCWRCPIACKGVMKKGTKYAYEPGTRRPEYESIGAFGPNCLNGDMESVIMCNDICNRYGLDTISAGSIVAFAFECYEKGIITKDDTDGLELVWGNDEAVVALTEKMAKREGIGDILADGVKIAAEKIGKGSEEFAVHVGGQEPGMHDPKVKHPLGDRVGAVRYQMDATPGRHNQGFGPSGFEVHLTNIGCYCVQGGYWLSPSKNKWLAGFLAAVTGRYKSIEDLYKDAERVATIRHAFNLREGINPLDWKMHGRMIGEPPFTQTEGPHAGVTVDLKAAIYWNLGALDWDRETTKPSRKKLMALGLEDVMNDLYPDPPPGPPGPPPKS
ncbi:MAG: aldehyde ferredoxin oxidoreductase family protein [Proteobacteria bacterium]|nr:aldehyde ferredoxin oxidoreductase family protein [Pseudomonadota bacterium]